ncbi:MAG: cytochrome c [Pseudomonadales bacterium]|nr:cytochrome c [Pseudomonadales bacterium]
MSMYRFAKLIFKRWQHWFVVLLLISESPLLMAADDGLNHSLTPRLGERVTAYVSSIVSPDGSGLPNGSGSVTEGKLVYNAKCAACHGVDGKMQSNQIVGGIGSLASERPVVTVGSYWPYATTLFDYIARAMPYGQAKTLSANEVYATTAYVLFLNGIVSEQTRFDATTLLTVDMPNQDGFVELNEIDSNAESGVGKQ